MNEMNWLISANSKIYDHKSSFLNHGYIDWHQVFNFSIGDIVYIYSSKPDSRITFKTIVDKINMRFDEVRDDRYYWKDITKYQNSTKGLFCKLTMIKMIDNENLSLKLLMMNGLKSAPQGAVKIKGNLLEYIEKNIDISDIDINLDLVSKYLEGSIQQALINRYERNKQARDKSIEHYGFTCQICGFNFYDTYGDLGKNFIHVHHIIPISNIKKNYIINPIEDLIPVCPNCHAMLHKKFNNKYYDIKELKQLINLKKI